MSDYEEEGVCSDCQKTDQLFDWQNPETGDIKYICVDCVIKSNSQLNN